MRESAFVFVDDEMCGGDADTATTTLLKMCINQLKVSNNGNIIQYLKQLHPREEPKGV
eukprot:UN26096